jgi:5-(carboxyamino)imidazole ribonucleotide synthase
MTHQAAISLAIELRFLADRLHDPASTVAPGARIGSALDPEALRQFTEECDVVTFDHEVVDLDALADLEAAGAVLRPSARTLRIVADKLSMRSALAEAGIPVPPSAPVEGSTDLERVMGDWPKAVLKLSHGGYDGRGVFMVDGWEEAFEAVAGHLAEGSPFIAEPHLELERELAVMVARRPGGQLVIYEPVETFQVDGQCRRITMPAPLSGDLRRQAMDLGRAVAETVDVVGILAVELFVVDGQLTVNELAARPHNSGHHTIEAATTSQFENHVRGVMDLPLGDPSPACTAAVTVNVIGRDTETDPRDLLTTALSVEPRAHIHLYGKQPRHNRKLGHVTVCDDQPEAAAEAAQRVAEALGSLEVMG